MQAIDIAPTFIHHAQASEDAEPLGIKCLVGNGMALPFAADSFDFATAFMSLMDMPDPALALQQAARVVRPGGFLQFSILHPCFVPPHRKVVRDATGQPRAVEIGGYFDCIDGRVDSWWFATLPPDQQRADAPFRTPRFHRTLSAWVTMIRSAGFTIEQLVEPSATPDVAASEPVVADTRVAPMSLLVRLRKPV